MDKISVYLQRKPIMCAVLEMRSSLRAVCTDVVFAQAVQRAFRAGNSTILFCFMTLLGVSWLFADPADSLSRYFETLLGTLLTSCNLSSLPQKSEIILSLHAHWHTDGSVDGSKWTPDYLSEWWPLTFHTSRICFESDVCRLFGFRTLSYISLPQFTNCITYS